MLAIYVLSATAYTVYAVPYLSMPAEMSTDSAERSRIMSYRMTFAMLGVLAGSALAPALLDGFGGGRAGFAAMSWVIGSLCAATMLAAFFGTAKSPDVSSPAETGKFTDGLGALARDTRFHALGGAYLLQLAGFGTFIGTAPYFVTTLAGRSEGAMSELFLALLGGTVVSMFAWNMLANRIGKTSAYGLSGALAMLGFAIFWLASGNGDWSLALIATLTIGIGFGGLQLLPFAILTDIIHAARLLGQDSAGAYTGVWTAVEKGGLALGPLIVGGLLSLGGYAVGAEEQASQALLAIQGTLTLVPAAFVALSIPTLYLCQARLKAVLAA